MIYEQTYERFSAKKIDQHLHIILNRVNTCRQLRTGAFSVSSRLSLAALVADGRVHLVKFKWLVWRFIVCYCLLCTRSENVGCGNNNNNSKNN